MKEKRTFILAIPTIIIIFVFIIGMGVMIYRKNYMPLSREKAINLSTKVFSIDNISCEVVTQGEEEKIVDYKYKNNILSCRYDNYIEITDGNDNNKCTYIDTNEKEVYIYHSSNNIESFKGLIYTVAEVLENNDYEYEFLKYETINGIKSASFKLKQDDSALTIWIDRENGMPIKIEGEYNLQSPETNKITTIYRYQIGAVKDEDIKNPDTEGYNVIEMD